MKRFGFVGFPNVGKSSLFNALAGGGAYAAPYAFSTTDPNVGVAKVPDSRLEKLARMSESRRVVPASVQFTDIGGLVEGANQGDGLGNTFLGHIRNTDAIVFVLRAFKNCDSTSEHSINGSECSTGGGDHSTYRTNDADELGNPLDQLQLLEIELALADLDSANRQLSKLARSAKGDKEKRSHVALLERAVTFLEEGTPIYRTDLDEHEKITLNQFFLLTNKPVMAVVNIGENLIHLTHKTQLTHKTHLAHKLTHKEGKYNEHKEKDDVVGIGFGDPDLPSSDNENSKAEDAVKTEEDGIVSPVAKHLNGAEVVPLCVQLEAEIAQLDYDDRLEMLDALELGDGALPRFLNSAYQLLGLRTFLTTGRKESRAWTFNAGATAPECAGVLHSDFQRGFIRAETIGCEELLKTGSWSAAREQGKIRSEGKHYQVADGDVIEFKFNV